MNNKSQVKYRRNLQALRAELWCNISSRHPNFVEWYRAEIRIHRINVSLLSSKIDMPANDIYLN